MAQVTIDITGNRGGGTPPPPNPDNNGSGGGRTPVNPPVGSGGQPDSRLMEDVRRAIIQQGAIYVPPGSGGAYKPIIQQAEQLERQRINNDITQRYDERRADAQRRMAEEYERIDRSSMSDEEKDAATIRVGKAFDRENEIIDREEAEERQQANEDLTRVIEELTEEIRRSGGNLNPNSFLSQLRAERQKAVVERDTAEDEETARQAAARVRELDKQINSVVRGEDEEEEDDKINWGLRTIQTMMGFDQIVRGMTNRDLGSMIMGAGQTLTSMFGMSDKAAARSLAFLKPLATIGTLFTQEAQKSDQMSGLAALIRNDAGTNGSIADTRNQLYENLWDYSPFRGGGASIYDMGLSVPEFAQSAERRIRARGMAEGGVEEAYFQEALERVFSLNSGALGDAGKYDRYGINATDAIANLVSRLERIQGSGVSQGNYVRVQEYLNMQQELMSQYMRFQDRPDYGAANRDIEAFTRLNNYTVDSRTSGDIRSVQNQLLSPQNDRMKALLYSTVEEMFSETAGRTDLIDQYLHDPDKMGMIEREYMRKLTNMYGGYDTPMGYWMIQSQLQGIESPERRRAIWEGIVNGEAGNVLATEQHFQGSEKSVAALQVESYSSELTQGLITLSDGVYAGVSIIENLVGKLDNIVRNGVKLNPY